MIQLIVKILLVELTSVFHRLLVLVQKYGKQQKQLWNIIITSAPAFYLKFQVFEVLGIFSVKVWVLRGPSVYPLTSASIDSCVHQ